ncbi:MAG: hypothetical protein LBB38_00970 [Puniceicoccales bacterium]|jgi:hypothetical protein|nr:hypothetical protein [Puniceicoccales bacterium]
MELSGIVPPAGLEHPTPIFNVHVDAKRLTFSNAYALARETESFVKALYHAIRRKSPAVADAFDRMLNGKFNGEAGGWIGRINGAMIGGYRNVDIFNEEIRSVATSIVRDVFAELSLGVDNDELGRIVNDVFAFVQRTEEYCMCIATNFEMVAVTCNDSVLIDSVQQFRGAHLASGGKIKGWASMDVRQKVDAWEENFGTTTQPNRGQGEIYSIIYMMGKASNGGAAQSENISLTASGIGLVRVLAAERDLQVSIKQLYGYGPNYVEIVIRPQAPASPAQAAPQTPDGPTPVAGQTEELGLRRQGEVAEGLPHHHVGRRRVIPSRFAVSADEIDLRTIDGYGEAADGIVGRDAPERLLFDEIAMQLLTNNYVTPEELVQKMRAYGLTHKGRDNPIKKMLADVNTAAGNTRITTLNALDAGVNGALADAAIEICQELTGKAKMFTASSPIVESVFGVAKQLPAYRTATKRLQRDG